MKKGLFWCLPVGAAGGAFLSFAGLIAPFTGLLLFISGLIGISYGLLFEHESPDFAAGIAWGLLYVSFGGLSAG